MPRDPYNDTQDLPIKAITVDALRSGHENATRPLMGLVTQWAQAKGLLREDAEDIAAVTVLKAYNDIDSFEGKSKLETWVLGIAQHVAEDFARRTTTGSISLEDLNDEPASDADVEELAYLQLVAKEALAALRDDERQAIELTKFRGLSNQEAAERLGRSYDGFTCLLYRVQQKTGRFFDENM